MIGVAILKRPERGISDIWGNRIRRTPGTFFSICTEQGWPDGRAGNHVYDCSGGKSGLHRTRWWVTPTGRKIRESATESKPPKPVRFFVSHGDFMQRRQVARTAKRLKILNNFANLVFFATLREIGSQKADEPVRVKR